MMHVSQIIKRPDSDSRGLHVHHEDTESLVRSGRGIGSGCQPAIGSFMSRAGEHLLPVDDIAVILFNGPRLKREEITTGLRLSVSNAHINVATGDPRDILFLLLIGTKGNDS